MISAKRVEELREAWGKFSMMDNISVSKHTLTELYDTLSAALKVVEAAKEWAKVITVFASDSPEQKVLDALAPFAEEKENK